MFTVITRFTYVLETALQIMHKCFTSSCLATVSYFKFPSLGKSIAVMKQISRPFS